MRCEQGASSSSTSICGLPMPETRLRPIISSSDLRSSHVFFSTLSWEKFAPAQIASSNVNSVSRKLASCHFKEQVSQLYHSKTKVRKIIIMQNMRTLILLP